MTYSLRVRRVALFAAMFIPHMARAQTSAGSIDRLVESIVQNAERLAASMERHANSLAQRIEREVNASVDSKYRKKSMRRYSADELDYDRSELTQVSRIDTTVAFSESGSIELSIAGGEIIVRGWDRTDARIKASSERGQFGYQLSRSRLIVDMEWSNRRRSSGSDTHIEITVPRGARLRVRTASGDVNVVDTRGEVDINATTGDVSVEGVRGHVEISSLSGDVSLRRSVGNVEITTVSGTIEVDEAEGDITLNSTSGDLVLANAKSSEVEMATSSGEVSFSGNIASEGRYEFTSHSGSIDIGVPASLNARFSLETYSGEIDSAFPITLAPRATTGGRPRRFEFSVGTGGPRIIAESFSGDIDIRKRN